MISVVCFKWSTPGYRATFTSEHVNTLRRMVARHYPDPHRFICITDDPVGLDIGIESVPLWDDFADVPNPTGGGRPSCYRRLKLWHPCIGQLIGSRFVMLDIDTVICGDLRPLWNRTEDVVMWECPTREWPYNGAMFIATAGARPQVWEDFDPERSPKETTAAGYRGSDQAWISHKLGWGEAAWTQKDGVYYFGRGGIGRKDPLPADARIVFTTGGNAPWTLKQDWVRKHFQ